MNEEHCELVKQVVMAKLEREELEDELVKCGLPVSLSLGSAVADLCSPFARCLVVYRQDRIRVSLSSLLCPSLSLTPPCRPTATSPTNKPRTAPPPLELPSKPLKSAKID